MKDPGLDRTKIIRRKRDGELEYQPDDLTVEEPLEIRMAVDSRDDDAHTGRDESSPPGFSFAKELCVRRNRSRNFTPSRSANRENIIVLNSLEE